MQLSHKERFVNAAAVEPTRSDLSRRQRRAALIERSFVFEGAFGDNPKLLEALETAEKAAPNALAITKETLAPLDAKERETLVALLSKLR